MSTSLLGTSAMLFEAPGEMSLASQQRIWALARDAQAWPEVREAVPGMNNLMLSFRHPPRDLDGLRQRLQAGWDAALALPLDGRVLELPVVYGGEGGPHMAEVVAHTGLAIDDIVELHSAPLYPVYALGSHPGYCYLGGMDPRIATPRRKVPVLSIPGGAVSIGGAQTGVSASAGPSGWNTIGCTTMSFFDATQDPPALLQPGDTIRFLVQRGDPMIEILSSAALATVQDLGRAGSLRWGVGTSGAMDDLALAAGNLMLGNARGAAGIEIPVFPFKLRFDADCAFALTGADCGASLNDQPLLPWWSHSARAGQVLTLGLPRGGAHRGSRAMLCVAGGIDVPEVLGSRSTQLRGAFGGLEGRALRRGDVLRAAGAGELRCTGFGLVPPALAFPIAVDGLPAVRVLPAAEYLRFEEASREAFWARPWKITAQSDRYGYRLDGQPLVPLAPMEMQSHGIVPGVIQVPASGQPIVQMRDAQPSGGYPKFGTVIEADLWRLGQAPIGSRVRFVETTWDEAVAALDQTRAWLDKVERMVALHHSAASMARR